jgi:hypothetical protein
MRAYMQRCEVRLSTIHRVASALLSGAGLIVIFPALAKDSVARLIRSLITSGLNGPRTLLLVAILLAFSLPMAGLWLLLKDLTHFYFSASHFSVGDSRSFFPRFSLSGLRIALDDTSEAIAEEIAVARRDPSIRAFLLPENDRARARVDYQTVAYGLRPPGTASDDDRQDALLEFATTRNRTLAQQTAGIEQVLSRHALNIQLLVLRYARAVVAMLITAAATFACAAVIDSAATVKVAQQVWLAGILALWAPLVVLAVTAPVRWVIRVAMADGANDRAVKDDREFTLFEDLAVRLASLVWILSVVAALLASANGLRTSSRAVINIALIVSAALFVLALAKWDGRRSLRRLFGLHRSKEILHKSEQKACTPRSGM